MRKRCVVRISGFGVSFLVYAMLVMGFARAGDLPVEKAILTDPPNVPPPITRSHAAKVIVELEVVEKIGKLSDGVNYTFWTFGGTVPGKFIRIREGDTVEFTLANHPTSKVPHNIDLHAVTGPGGGAASTATAPGHKTRFTFKALNPGLYIYHCATAPVGMHIANGMYGLIYVQPERPLPKVDREFYVVQGDFYTAGENGAKGLQSFSQQKAVDERPTYVVFNGAAGSLVGDKALPTKVGESVRIFMGNGGPNLVSSFHVIGEIFDRVYFEGGIQKQEHVQTTLIPAGGSAIVEFKVDVPGTYILVDHSIFRTFHKGSLGMLKVEGPENKAIYSGKELDEPYTPAVAPSTGAIDSKDPKEIYAQTCLACHQENGQGDESNFPPLAKSDYLAKLSAQKDRSELIQRVIGGQTGKMTVNGKEYDGVMPPQDMLTDAQMAAVLTYITNSWGNRAKKFTESEVKAARAKMPATR